MNKHDSAARQNVKGFALVLVLLVSALFLMILIAAFSRLEVETKVQANTKFHDLAKENALYALEEALFQLQNFAGSDQRITTEAGRVWQGEKVQHPHWLGVWDTTALGRLSISKPMAWLVSGEEVVSPVLPLPQEESVWLVYEAVGRVASESVRGRKITREDLDSHSKYRGLKAGYAWWVGDESSKVKVNRDPDLKHNKVNLRTRIPSQLAVHRMKGFESIVPWSEEQHKVFRVSQLPMLATSNKQNAVSQALPKLFHEVTGESLSVLSDPIRGGLKEDFSVVVNYDWKTFQKWKQTKEGIQPEFYKHANQIYQYHQVGKNFDWQNSKRVFSAAPFSLCDEKGELTIESATRWLNSTDKREFDGAKIVPEWMGFGFECRLNFSDGKCGVELQPWIRVWNPFNAAIRSEGMRFKLVLPDLNLVLQGRRIWKAGESYSKGDEVWHRDALYLAEKETSLEPNEAEGTWRKMARKWSWMKELKMPKEPYLWTLSSQSDQTLFEAGSIVDLTLDSDSAHKLVRLGTSGNPTILIGHFEDGGIHPSLLEEDFEYQVILEPSRIPWQEYAARDPHHFIREHALSEPDESNSQISYMIQEVRHLENASDDDWFPVKRLKLPTFSFGNVNSEQPFEGLKVQFQGQIRDPLSLGILGVQFEGFDDVSFFQNAKNLHKSMPVNARLFQRNPLLKLEQSSVPQSLVGFVIEAKNQSWQQWLQTLSRSRNRNAKVLYEIPSTPPFSLGQWQHLSLKVDASLPYDFAYSDPTGVGLSMANEKLAAEIWDSFYYSGADSPDLDLYPYYQSYRKRRRIGASMSTQTSALDLPKKTSDHYLLSGGFNINSTNLEAWKAVLGSIHSMPMKYSTKSYGVLLDGAKKDHLFSRCVVDPEASVALSEAQIDELAKHLVREIEIRRPFRSIAEFLSTRSDPEQHTGTLDAAIQKAQLLQSVSSANQAGVGEDLSVIRWRERETEEAAGSDHGLPPQIRAGSENLFLSGDLLQVLAPILTSRSDTFKVRAYGELRERSTGKLVSRAWCEAVIQRLPEYLIHEDQNGDTAWTDPALLKHPDNKKYGRRFEILHLKWLAPDEV